MRWLWRFLIYFVKPLAIWYIAGYFGFQSIKAVAYAVTSYQRSVKKAELQAEAKRSRASASAADRGAEAGGVNSGRK